MASLSFVESLCDASVKDIAPAGIRLCFACRKCDSSFIVQRALESHCRAKHGERLTSREFIKSSICPSCGTDYRQRLRCLAHISDRRRPKCAEWVLANCKKLPAKVVAKLDPTDLELRKQAQRLGRSHHIADLPAMTSRGCVTGRVS